MALMPRLRRPACRPDRPLLRAAAASGRSWLGGCDEFREFFAQLPLKPINPRRQLLDLTIHPQQHLDHDLTPRVIDRLRLAPLHTPKFDRAELCPPDQLNESICRHFGSGETRT